MDINYKAKSSYCGEIAIKYETERKKNWLFRAVWRNEFKHISYIFNHLPKGSLILDIPCGTGRFIPFSVKSGFRIIGSDISLDMISQGLLKNFPKPFKKFVVADAEYLPFKNNSVDFVLSMRFLRHLPPEVKPQVLFEFSRVCRYGIIISVPLFDNFTWAHSFLSWLRRNFAKRKKVMKNYPITGVEFEKLVAHIGLRLKYIKKVLTGFRANICFLIPDKQSEKTQEKRFF